MIRPSVSAAPPAANGAMILTGRFGQFCACAEAGECRGGEDYCTKSQHEHDRRLANVPPTLAQVQTPVMARCWAATN
jgi:hypothetical protein